MASLAVISCSSFFPFPFPFALSLEYGVWRVSWRVSGPEPEPMTSDQGEDLPESDPLRNEDDDDPIQGEAGA